MFTQEEIDAMVDSVKRWRGVSWDWFAHAHEYAEDEIAPG